MNDNNNQSKINKPTNKPYVTNRKFINNMNRFKNKYPPKKFIKRSSSTDNLNRQQQQYQRSERSEQQPQQQQTPAKQEERKQESIDIKGMLSAINGLMDRKLVDFTGRVNGLIELKTKYYVDQRINVLENSNDLLTRGANELAIQADPTNAGNSFQFKYNGDSVARITDTGILYCRNLWVNGLNIIATLNSMMNTETETAGVLGDYVKHIELKNGTYELNVKDTVTKHLALTNDDNSEYVHLNYDDTNNNLSINFNNEAAKYVFYNDRCEFLVPLTVTSITSGNILGTNIYASTSLTVDGTALITQLDVANTTKNTWYAKFRCEDYLSNNDYLRIIFKDLSKQAYIDFTRDTQYYKLKLYINGSPGMLTINETGLEFDGQVDSHNDLVCWQKLLASDIYAGTSSYINLWNGVVCQSNLQVDGLTQLKRTDIIVGGNSSSNDALVITDNNLTSGHAVDIIIGQDENSSGNSSIIAYHYTSDNDSTNYLGIGMLGYSELIKIFRDKIELLNSLYCTSIIVNGITVDVPNIAYTNISNTFTQAQNISVDSQIPLTITHPTTITASTGFKMKFTDGTGSSLTGLWMDPNNKYYTYMKLENKTTELRVYDDKVNVTTTMNAKQYELQSASTDYYSGFGYNFMKVLMDTVYPIGSIYMSMTELQNENYYPETSPNNKFEVWWHGCTWRLLDNGVFLRNGEFKVLDVSGSVDPSDPYKYRYYITGAGNTGGSATHTHPLSDNGYACVATHGAGNMVVRERTTPAWPATHRMSTGSYGTAPDTDSWGQCLRGNTDNASSLPPYMTCYMYQRIA